jgi:hypothetical protein
MAHAGLSAIMLQLRALRVSKGADLKQYYNIKGDLARWTLKVRLQESTQVIDSNDVSGGI